VVPGNLVLNGSFSLGDAYWHVELNGGTTVTYSSAGELCVTNDYSGSYASVTLGYPLDAANSFAVDAASSYTLSYRARGSLYYAVEVKVGGAVEPWYPAAAFNDGATSVGYQSYSHLVMPSTTLAQAGLAFNVVLDPGVTYCIDDVVLTKL